MRQVAAYRLADLFGRAFKIQNIIHNLEGHAKFPAVLFKSVRLIDGRAAQDSAGLTGSCEQRCSLIVYPLVITLHRLIRIE